MADHLRLTATGRVYEWLKLFAHDAVWEFPISPAGVPRRFEVRHDIVAHMRNFLEVLPLNL